ncbi:hypothetical protein GPECTOR_11g247 [Gonium pectorale]|uniref:BACK domain-containing protein n=1 Tax=Gonium pectorale TaxID=33097 RepID=A0A150GPS4_GONPE|nr:hypothetical protein GPECTOR_11g247 [Gonium pectorale]|eukprot:KXZ51805.1 hypothetical protein GPECTOR_11g247 [Gonium pectorale]
MVLRACSERFSAQLRRWSNDKESRVCDGRAGQEVGQPVLRVPLGSEAELPGARAAIRFAYTGEVAADSVREALELWQQASYLGIELCAAACVERVRVLLDAQAAAAAEPPFLQLFKCSALWPNPNEELGFAAVLASAKKKLAAHFRDAPLALNSPVLLSQLSELPAEALEGLLESDDFGTDSEDTVLLLLAEWMAVNHDRTDATARERLCRQVRLLQLGRAYLGSVLPALAAAHQRALAAEGSGRSPSPAGWFPIGVQELAFITALASSLTDREAWKAEAAGVYDLDSPWYLTRPRRQCIPAAGREYPWHIAQTSLAAALAALQLGKAFYLHCEASGSQLGTFAHGLVWRPALYIGRSDPPVAMLVLRAAAPPVFMQGPVKLPVPGRLMGLPRIEALLTMRRWQAGERDPPHAEHAPRQAVHPHTSSKIVDRDVEDLVVAEIDDHVVLFRPFEAKEVDEAATTVMHLWGGRPGDAGSSTSAAYPFSGPIVHEPDEEEEDRVSRVSSSSGAGSDGAAADAIIEATAAAALGDSGQRGGDRQQLQDLMAITTRLLRRPGMQREVVLCMMEDPEVRELMLRQCSDLDRYLLAAGITNPQLLPAPSDGESTPAAGGIDAVAGAAGPSAGTDGRSRPDLVSRLVGVVAGALEHAGNALARLGDWLRRHVAMAMGQELEEEVEEVGAGGAAPGSARGQRPVNQVLGGVMVLAVAVFCVAVIRRPIVLRAVARR